MPRRAPRTARTHTPPVAVVVSRYNHSVTSALLDGARRESARRGGPEPVVVEVPGSFELVAGCLAAARTGRFAGVVALGCLIKGDTIHDRVIADAVAGGLAHVTLRTGVPVSFGVLTVDTPRQARARAGGAKGNKGEEAMAALLDTIAALRGLGAGRGVRLSARRDKAGGRR
ncbi:MAG: 6,7-dimethyl-8-ribityllumazine synthase [Phycisphaerae bacterium]|nr:6,7-dimethyl-8-ribityllumazine synthase [Phycisphaerae bacterium]